MKTDAAIALAPAGPVAAVAVVLSLALLGGCDRKPTNPPKPAVQAGAGATAAAAPDAAG